MTSGIYRSDINFLNTKISVVSIFLFVTVFIYDDTLRREWPLILERKRCPAQIPRVRHPVLPATAG